MEFGVHDDEQDADRDDDVDALDEGSGVVDVPMPDEGDETDEGTAQAVPEPGEDAEDVPDDDGEERDYSVPYIDSGLGAAAKAAESVGHQQDGDDGLDEDHDDEGGGGGVIWALIAVGTVVFVLVKGGSIADALDRLNNDGRNDGLPEGI